MPRASPCAINGGHTDLNDKTAERFGVGNMSGGIDAACEFFIQMLRDLERVAEHFDMSEDLTTVLSITNVAVEYRTTTGVKID